MRTHDRNHFFKYVDEKAAKLIIQNQTFKWTCPLDFNDPFDHRIQLISSDDLKQLAERAVKKVADTVWDNYFDQFDSSKAAGALLINLRRYKEIISKEDFLSCLEGVTDEMAQNGKNSHEIFLQEYNDLLLKTRVLCVSEDNNNILMWSHYANSHKGAVFKLNAIDELDISLLMAKKVTYSKNYPCLQTEDEMFEQVCCVHDVDYEQRFRDLVCVKSEDWAYEREWRLSIQRDIAYSKEPSAVFGAIYLGCMMSLEDRKQIITLAKTHLPEMEIWQAIQSTMGYEVNFERLLLE